MFALFDKKLTSRLFATVGLAMGIASSHIGLASETAPTNENTKSTRDIVRLHTEDELQQEDSKLKLSVTPVFWYPHTNSENQVSGLSVPVSLEAEDIVAAVDGGINLIIKAQKGKNIVSSEIYYSDSSDMKARVYSPIGEIPVMIDSKFVMVDLWVGRRFETENDVWIELYVGGRYGKSESTYKYGNMNSAMNYEWEEVTIAQHSQIPLTERVSLFSRSSVGSQGRGPYSYDAMLGVRYDYNSHVSVMGGYREQQLTYTDNNKDFETKSRSKGPFISLSIAF